MNYVALIWCVCVCVVFLRLQLNRIASAIDRRWQVQWTKWHFARVLLNVTHMYGVIMLIYAPRIVTPHPSRSRCDSRVVNMLKRRVTRFLYADVTTRRSPQLKNITQVYPTKKSVKRMNEHIALTKPIYDCSDIYWNIYVEAGYMADCLQYKI